MATPETAQRASSFGSVADAYDRFRPGPPLSAVDWILSSTGGTAADLGAGTGALTRQLAQRVDNVVACGARRAHVGGAQTIVTGCGGDQG